VDERESRLEKPEPLEEPEQLEQKVDAIREDLDGLVDELDRRRHRAAKPLLIGAAASLALVVAFVLWRRARA
jgi:hypothetical protein